MTAKTDLQFQAAQPMIFDRRKKKKKRKNTAIAEFARAERRLTNAALQIADSSAAGIKRFRKRRRKVSAKRQRRYVMDFVPSALEGAAVAARRMSLVPFDLMTTFYTRRSAKLAARGARSAIRTVTRILTP